MSVYTTQGFTDDGRRRLTSRIGNTSIVVSTVEMRKSTRRLYPGKRYETMVFDNASETPSQPLDWERAKVFAEASDIHDSFVDRYKPFR